MLSIEEAEYIVENKEKFSLEDYAWAMRYLSFHTSNAWGR